jgi:hypothetical protein
MNKQQKKQENWIEYYNHKSILNEITDGPVDLCLDEHLRKDILSGKRRRRRWTPKTGQCAKLKVRPLNDGGPEFGQNWICSCILLLRDLQLDCTSIKRYLELMGIIRKYLLGVK